MWAGRRAAHPCAVAVPLVNAVFHSGAAADSAEGVTGELVVVLELQPVHQALGIAVATAMQKSQQSVAVQPIQHSRTEPLAEKSGLFGNLRRRHQFAGRQAAIDSLLQFVEEMPFEER